MWPFIRRCHINMVLDIVLRVPGLIIIDYWWQYERTKSLPHSTNSKDVLNAVIINIALVHGFLLLLLPLPRVQALYTHFVSFILLFSAHMISGYYVHLEQGYISFDNSFLTRQLLMLILHLTIAIISNFLLSGSGKPYPLVLAAFTLPVIARLFELSAAAQEMIHNFSSTLIAFSILRYIYFQVPNILKCVKEAYEDALMVTEANGWMAVPIMLWNKLFIPNHFLMFWVSQFCLHLFSNIWHPYRSHIWGEEWYTLALGTVSTICASPVSLVATAVTVSYVSCFFLRITKSFLCWEFVFTNDSPMHSGWTEGLTLVLFALQTGLIEMKMPARMAVMTIILFIDLSTLLQSMLEITEPVILSLSASRSKNLFKHVRAFSMCTFLFFFPLFLTHSLSQVFSVDFWMIVLLSSCILTSVQVLDLLVIHALFLYDSTRAEPWDLLDDVVYYTRAVTKVLEFLVAVFVVVVGMFESSMGKFNWANSSIIVVHCYFNIWQRLQSGWRSFLLRREAVQKTMSLPSASFDQLNMKNDVCAICFVDMKTACITPCSHFFHRTCLRKWLYIQDTCPLCHASIAVIEQSSNEAATLPADNVENDNNVQNES